MSTDIEKVLDKARWAPSGDNEQPWRIKVLSPDSCEVTVGYFLNTPFHLERRPDHIALGGFIETFHIAAKDLGFEVRSMVKNPSDNVAPVYTFYIVKAANIIKDPLADVIERRAVNRFPYSRKSLSEAQKQQIEKSLPVGYTMVWFEGKERMTFAKVVYEAGIIRYVLPEMFTVHSKIIDWENALSLDKVPSKAMGVPIIFLPLIKWLMGKRERMEGYNRFFKGDVSTALQLEFLPSLFSAAGIAIIADKEPVVAQDWVEAGRAIQRFWLSAVSLGLAHQPAFTPLIFSKYADKGLPLTTLEEVDMKNREMSRNLTILLGGEVQKNRAVWMGRVGFAGTITSRSMRRPLADFITE